jgi:hypothetical protein
VSRAEAEALVAILAKYITAAYALTRTTPN